MKKIFLVFLFLLVGCSTEMNKKNYSMSDLKLYLKAARDLKQDDESKSNPYPNHDFVTVNENTPILKMEANDYHFIDDVDSLYQDFLGFYWKDNPTAFDLAVYSFFYTGEFTTQPDANTIKFIFDNASLLNISDEIFKINEIELSDPSAIDVDNDSLLMSGSAFRDCYYSLFNCNVPFDESKSWSVTDLGKTFGYLFEDDTYFYSYITAGIIQPGYSGYNLLVTDIHEQGNMINVNAVLFYSATEVYGNDWDNGTYTIIYKADGSRLTHNETLNVNESSLKDCILANRDKFEHVKLQLKENEDSSYALISAAIVNCQQERVELDEPDKPIITIYRKETTSELENVSQAIPQFNLTGSAAYRVNSIIKNSYEIIGYETEINDQYAIIRGYGKDIYNTSSIDELIVKCEYTFDRESKQFYDSLGVILKGHSFENYLQYNKVR